MDYIKSYFKRYVLTYFIFSTAFLSVIYPFLLFFFIPIFILILKRQKITTIDLQVISFITIITYLLSFVCCIISKGNFTHFIWNIFYIWTFPFFIINIMGLLFGLQLISIIIIFILLTIQLISYIYLLKYELTKNTIIIGILSAMVIVTTNVYFYNQSPAKKYIGHGFEYMNGYSSTDLSPYYPYTKDNKLVKLNTQSTLLIENEEDMPILDGAEACYPVYAAIAQATYKDINKIELNYKKESSSTNGKIVSFTNTSIGYRRLIEKEIDMFFGAKPSSDQLEEAKMMGVELEYTPIGKEAFVFFVNQNNPITSLTTHQIKSIYHGDITNWKDVGGKDNEIIAFQRPAESGSQSMMNYFMGDVSLKEPLTYERQSSMGGIINEVAQYYNEDGALGYTFKYFLEGLNQEDNVKILSVDDIYPTSENIKEQSYPISTYLYCVTLKSNTKENVRKLKEFLLSDQGQYIIEQTGYYSLN